jgi:hypothetical protein
MAYRLGDFLVEKEFVSADHLLIALERQEKSRTPLGQLAIEVGMVSAKDVLVILTEQRNSENKAKFGDIAVNKGILLREDIEKLFKIQEEKAELLGNILINIGAISPPKLLKALREYDNSKKG